MKNFARMTGAAIAALLIGGSVASATEITFYYPIAVGGPITKIVDGYAAEFTKAHPDITVKPVYTGSYQDSVVKAMTAAKAGSAPDLAVLLSTDMFSLIDDDLIVPIDTLATSADDKAWIKAFYPAFMENSQSEGHSWGIPFQRSTIVQYWNKDLFKAAGLDPDRAPGSWDEMVSFGKKLTKKDESGNVSQWGIEIPSSGFPYWLFQALTTQNGAILANDTGTKVAFNDPKVIEAAQFFADLGQKYQVMPKGIIEWGTTPKDFFEGKTAMMWTTTGNLTNVKKNAKFAFGVAPLPTKVRGGSPTGGGNIYIFKGKDKAKQQAALAFARFLTTPEKAADWGMATGYIAVRPDAWQTEAMKSYATDFPPAAVARDQLKEAVAELSTHDNQRVTKTLNDALQAVLTGAKPAKQALDQAQAEATRILKPYQK
ncbi:MULTISPECIES: ABC transporter substrate-binding protein [Rhodopseudomonas]|uniref:ABC transporter substrate-binding protein n=1 Tax=Rhodopseudomonas palustris TaxID=1076 RepID=A0A0D7EF29_RHOPL|nr:MULTISPECIES: ABC transporter substrate-binding protein [Rhodopseudomonas]KIZ39140.1 ABC transporter substrate-binding protein [Rhodopseudomonas palustris]MDF3813604.1 ABC transporter substrate-binding protein [Rhodopseudomonas sp. BAL398]WOK17006.1 ABC transporter substrate-binding protein [Rhodopseudomonas sp. BAL398]